MRKLLPIFLGVVWLSASGYAAASAMLTVEGGRLVSAWGVEVDGRVLDVTFVDGPCVDVFDGCQLSDFFFGGDPMGAEAASLALLNHVFIDEYDLAPELTLGCGSNVCAPKTPYARDDGDVLSYQAINLAQTDDFVSEAQPYDPTFPSEFDPTTVWVVWSESQVPTPSTLLLTGLGLGLLGATRRRKRETAAV